MAADRLSLDRLRDLRERAEALTRPDRWSDPDYEDNLGILAALDELIERRAEAPAPPSLPFG